MTTFLLILSFILNFQSPEDLKQLERIEKYNKLLKKAYIYVRANNLKRAFKVYEKAIKLNPLDPDIYYNLVVVGEAIKKFEKAYFYAIPYLNVFKEAGEVKKIKKIMNNAFKVLKKKGKLSVKVKQKGAKILINNAFFGYQKVGPHIVPQGKYEIKVTLKDYYPQTKSIEILDGDEKIVEFDLKPIIYYGYLEVKTEPEKGVSVYLDEKFLGKTPLKKIKLETGKEYLLKLKLEGYDLWQRYIKVAKDKTKTVNAKLEKPEKEEPDEW